VTTANRNLHSTLTYVVDDATWLLSQPSSSQDVITCCLGLTDVPNLVRVYQATYRVLRPGGVAISSIIHPAAPCSTAEGGLDYLPVAYHEETVYTTNNHKSVRGRVPTYHRPLSQYLSLARAAGLQLADLVETRAPEPLLRQQPLYGHVPYGLVLKFQKPGAARS
ncbi:class I SAM-dependent methyltransferase, partial [Dictyobacter formicarum]